MKTLGLNLAAALNRRAATVHIEDGLASILRGDTLVRTTANNQPRHWSGLVGIAAVAILAVGGAGLVWATRYDDPTPPTSASPVPATSAVSPRRDEAPAGQTQGTLDAVHLRLGDGWEMTSADRDTYRSTWASTARTSDDPDLVTTPSVHVSTTSERNTRVVNGVSRSTDITIAGVAAILYSNPNNSLHAAVVPLRDGRYVEIVIEDASADQAVDVARSMTPVSVADWADMVGTLSSPTTTLVIATPDAP